MPGSHRTWGECARAARFQVAPIAALSENHRTRTELEAYADARRQGVQPAGTKLAQTRAALDRADRMGVAT